MMDLHHMDHLSVHDKHYDKKYQDMQERISDDYMMMAAGTLLKCMNGEELAIDCDRAEASVVFDGSEDVGILARMAREEPANYVSIAMRPGGVQDYVDVWNELN